MSPNDFLDWLKKIIETLIPAFAVMAWNYQQVKIEDEKHEVMRKDVELKEEQNNEKINNKYANASDLDVISDAIKSGEQSSEENRGVIKKPSSSIDS